MRLYGTKIMGLTGAVLSLVLLAPGAAHSEPHEFLGCNFIEGKGMADVDRWLADFKATVDRMKSTGYKAVILTPQFDTTPDSPDFFWMGTWPDAASMGSNLKEYIEDGVGAKLEESLADIADCTGRTSLWWGRTVYERK